MLGNRISFCSELPECLELRQSRYARVALKGIRDKLKRDRISVHVHLNSQKSTKIFEFMILRQKKKGIVPTTVNIVGLKGETAFRQHGEQISFWSPWEQTHATKNKPASSKYPVSSTSPCLSIHRSSHISVHMDVIYKMIEFKRRETQFSLKSAKRNDFTQWIYGAI